MLLTINGYNKLRDDLEKLIKVDLPYVVNMLEETRPIGVSDEFPPEYLQALDLQNRVEKKILDLRNILKDCCLFDSTMVKRNGNDILIGFGCSVVLYNYETNKDITYSIVSSFESDVSKGLISIDCPFAKEMLGLKVGDSFEFNDNEYEIKNVKVL